MLNIDDRFLTEVTQDQFWFMCHVAQFMNENATCFPSNQTLCERTNWKISKLNEVKKSCIDANLIKVETRFVNNRQSSNEYTITTDRLSVLVNLKGKKAKQMPTATATPYRDGDTQGATLAIPPHTATATTEVLTNKEVLTSEEREHAPAPAQISSTLNTSISDKDNSPARPAISFGDRPGARTPTELVNAMREFYQTYPGEREAGLMERAKARRYNLKQRETITAEWAAHVIKTNHGGDTYQMLNADLQGWYLRQPQFDKAPVNNLSSTQGPAYRAYQEPV